MWLPIENVMPKTPVHSGIRWVDLFQVDHVQPVQRPLKWPWWPWLSTTWGNLYSQRVLATLETLGIHISLLPQVVPGEVWPEMTWNSAVSSQASPQPQWTMNFLNLFDLILIYHLPLSSVAHRLQPPNLRNPHQLQINYISENHQNPRPNSHKCI